MILYEMIQEARYLFKGVPARVVIKMALETIVCGVLMWAFVVLAIIAGG